MACEKCGKELQIGEHPFCPHGFGTAVAVGDECDVWIRHGLCNEDGSPRRYRSKTEIRQECEKRGMVSKALSGRITHIDGSKHTSRWI